MIDRIEGILEALEANTAVIRPAGGLTYRVYLPAYTAARLGGSLGQTVTLHTFHYLEGQGQGSSFIPRLAGFVSAADREFFELFTDTKGIGYRKALRAMAIATDQIAAAIADRDLTMLQSLPEIGRRTAETVVATLHGKVDVFLAKTTYAAGSGTGAADGLPGAGAGGRGMAREALEVLLQLGEQRAQAVTWIDEALRQSGEKDKPRDVQALIALVYRIKAGG